VDHQANVIDSQMEVTMKNVWVLRNVSAVLFAVAFLFGVATPGGNSAAAQGSPAIGSIEVDVSALRAKGVGAFADLVGNEVRRELQAHYSPGRGGARLVVSLDTLFLTGSPGGDGIDGFGGFLANDALGGTNRLVGPDGRVIDTYPLNITSPATRAGPPNLALERERAMILGQVYAQWLVRRF